MTKFDKITEKKKAVKIIKDAKKYGKIKKKGINNLIKVHGINFEDQNGLQIIKNQILAYLNGLQIIK